MKSGTVEQPEGLKSLHLLLENFKNIEKKEIEIGGRSLFFMGKNNSGKSTLIQAMMSSMDAKLLPTEPIKKGEEHARISHKIGGYIGGEYKEYVIDIYFNQSNNKGRLKVTNEKGEVQKSPATLVKSIIGNVSFDVTKWLNDTKANKLKTIKALTGCEKEIDIINRDIESLKDALKAKKGRADDLEATLKNHEFTKEEIEKYSTTVDMGPIQAEMAAISNKQQQYDGIIAQMNGFKRDVEDAGRKITAAGAEINRLNAEIARLQNSLREQGQIIADQTAVADKANENLRKGEQWLNNTPRPSMDVLNEKMSAAIAHNEKASRLGMLSGQHKEMVSLRVEADKLKGDIAALTDKRSEVIAKSQLSIPGLSFTDDDIFINDLPLEEGQINTAGLFDIGVEVAIAMNPTLKIIFLHDGSLFDKEHLKSIVRRIEERGYMAVVEVVAETNEVEAVFTENFLN